MVAFAAVVAFAALSSAPLWVCLVVGLLLEPAPMSGHWLRICRALRR